MSDSPKPSNPFRPAVEFIEEADRVLWLAVQGIRSVSKSAELVKALVRYDHFMNAGEDKPLPDNAQAEIEEAHSVAAMATSEVESDFPLLHAHTIVAMWSALESMMPRLAITWLMDNPKILTRPEFDKIRVPASLLESQSIEGRMAYVVDELMKAQHFDMRPGVGRFEGLLGALGLSGPVPDHVRRDLYELSQVRNLIVHRASVVDDKFVAACPWLAVKSGQRLMIGHGDYVRYRKAIMAYTTEVVWRAVEARGGKRPKRPLIAPGDQPTEGSGGQ